MGNLLNQNLQAALSVYIADYNQLHQQNALESSIPPKMSNLCISLLNGRMGALEAQGLDSGDEYRECKFLSGALSNGWLVSDLNMLSTVYETIQSMEDGAVKTEGQKLLDQMSSIPINTVTYRIHAFDALISYLAPMLDEESFSACSDLVIDQYKKKQLYPCEYPNDKQFSSFIQADENTVKASYWELIKENDRRIALKAEADARAREKEDYVITAKSEAEREKERSTPFRPNAGQRHNKITKSTRQAIEETFGSAVYDEIDEMQQGSVAERTVPLFHSQGNKWLKAGHEVLEFEFAGSGDKIVRKPQKSRRGVINTGGLSEDEVNWKYGQELKGHKFIRKAERNIASVNGQNIQKLKYSLAGPSPDWSFLSGLFNLGSYSIESTRAKARDFAKQFLEPRFTAWLNGKENPEDIKDIYIGLMGHSRGAVAAGQAVKKIHEWIQEYANAHPEFRKLGLDKKIHYDLRLLDPVPGAITDLHLGSCNLRNIPNVNTTVICSMAQNHVDFVFPLQQIKGAKRIILTTTDHSIDQNIPDTSQETSFGDGKRHAGAYYDAETGEMYRGSGMGQMPEGIYISDEKHNLVRLTSYSQVSRLFNSVYGKESPQRIRAINIHKMVRDWFVENQLEMSFPDEKTRSMERTKNQNVNNRILSSPNKRLDPVKREIQLLHALQEKKAPKENIIEQNKKLIAVCRAYMEKTRIPAEGDSAYRIDLVSDALSFTMRENNSLQRELELEKGHPMPHPLDDKIAKHHHRMEVKEGYLSRKLKQEQARHEKETNILKSVEETAETCRNALSLLNNTRVGKSQSDDYKSFYAALQKGAKLDSKASLKEITQCYQQLTESSDQYKSSHDVLIGPRTADGKLRLNLSKEFAELGKRLGMSVEVDAAGLGDPDIPLNARLESRDAEIQMLQSKIQQEKLLHPQLQKPQVLNRENVVAL